MIHNSKSVFIPKEVENISHALTKADFESYLVGGCVRDLLLGRIPKDWDIATNARPEEIQKIFPDSVYENKFGTVGVKIKPETRNKKQETRNQKPETRNKKLETSGLDIVEITTYRKEGRYTDKRHPDEIKFAKSIEEDLARRDFTVNAMALQTGIRNQELRIKGTERTHHNSLFLIPNSKIIDPFAGQKDLENKIVRAVGNSDERFNEDALRMMRAVRLAAELNFKIETGTAAAIKKHAGLLEMIAKERIRDELVKLLMAPLGGAANGVNQLTELGLMKYIMPELLEGVAVGQNKHHIYTVYEHNVRALDYAAGKNYSLLVRLASLLHDVGKPRTKRGEGSDSTFYAHEIVGARMTLKILDRLRFSKEMVEKTAHLVRHHLFYYNVGEVTAAGVRRFLRKVGPENIADLIKVREADRIGSGVPKAVPYKLRHLLFMIDKVKQDPIGPAMLKIDGNDVMKITGLTPGPKIGQIIIALLEEILDDPQNNTRDYLGKRIKELNELPEADLKKLTAAAKKKKEEFESGAEEEIKRKHYVK